MDSEKCESSAEIKNGTGQPRFNNHLKKNLVRIHKNLYLNQNDPLYYEKILRYSNSQSPEAHYMIAQKYDQAGSVSKALFHYQEAARSLSSPYYGQAKQAMRRFQNKDNRSEPANKSFYLNAPQKTTKMSTLGKSMLVCLLLFNLALLVMLLNMDTIRVVVSAIKHSTVGVGKEVVYETIDVPYVIYLADEPTATIEKVLYSKAIDMGKKQPKHNIQLFGIMTSDPTRIGKIVPLANEKLKEAAFVKAQYYAAIDQSVKIQFQNNEFRKQTGGVSLPLTYAAANLVRTALQTYLDEKGVSPHSIENLIGDYPNNYLSFIPNEVLSGNNHVATQFDGKGGWIYHSNAKQLSDMFYPNIADERIALQIPYEPVQIVISKKDYTLKVTSGSSVLASKSVGLGNNELTPEGSFSIHDRVVSPLGKHPNVYGEAGLGMGPYAIHGTYDEASIRANNSLGCVRLSNRDILDIFPLVPKGASVQITADLSSAYLHAPLIDSNRLFPTQKPQTNQTSQNTFRWLG